MANRGRFWLAIAGSFLLGGAVVFVAIGVYSRLRCQGFLRDYLDCQANLARVYQAVNAYATSHSDYLPPSLDVLVREGLVQPKLLRCPASGEEYLYRVQGLTVTEGQLGPSQPVIIERGFPHPTGIWLSPWSGENYKQFRGTFGAGRVTAEVLCVRLEERDPETMMMMLETPEETEALRRLHAPTPGGVKP